MISIDDLLAATSEDEVYSKFVAALVSLKIPADRWRKGGAASSILRAVARSYADFWNLIVEVLRGGFLETASGPWLVLLAYYVYGVTAQPATFASGLQTLTNAGGGVYSYAAGAVAFRNSSTGKTYRNTAPFTLLAGATITVAIQANESGSASSAVPGAIDTLVTSMLGVTTTNVDSIVGLDAIGDPELRQLCLDALGARSANGPRSAYAYSVRVATRGDGTPVNINRFVVSTSSHFGTVTVCVASPSGVPAAQDVTAVATSIEANARPEPAVATTVPAVAVSYAPTLTVWARSAPGLAASDVQTAAAAALSAFISAYPIGGLTTSGGRGLFASGVDGAVKSGHASIFAVEGASTLTLSDGQVAVDGATLAVRMVST